MRILRIQPGSSRSPRCPQTISSALCWRTGRWSQSLYGPSRSADMTPVTAGNEPCAEGFDSQRWAQRDACRTTRQASAELPTSDLAEVNDVAQACEQGVMKGIRTVRDNYITSTGPPSGSQKALRTKCSALPAGRQCPSSVNAGSIQQDSKDRRRPQNKLRTREIGLDHRRRHRQVNLSRATRRTLILFSSLSF